MLSQGEFWETNKWFNFSSSILKKKERKWIQIEGQQGSNPIGPTDNPGTSRVSCEYAVHTKTDGNIPLEVATLPNNSSNNQCQPLKFSSQLSRSWSPQQKHLPTLIWSQPIYKTIFVAKQELWVGKKHMVCQEDCTMAIWNVWAKRMKSAPVVPSLPSLDPRLPLPTCCTWSLEANMRRPDFLGC